MRRSMHAKGGDHIAQIPCDRGWSYFFSFTCGSQGWTREEAESTSLDECPFVRHPHDNADHHWHQTQQQQNDYAVETQFGYSKADLDGILRALRNDQLPETRLKAKEGIPGSFSLPDAFEAVQSLAFPAPNWQCGASQQTLLQSTVVDKPWSVVAKEVEQVKLRFCWKDYLKHQFGSNGVEMLQPSEAFLQVHESAR
eukprot:4577576-Amphidinium_carterae.1